MRFNKVIEKFEAGTPHVMGIHVENDDVHKLRAVAEGALDYVILDMEHEGFDLPMLSRSLHELISRTKMRETGDPFAGPTPIVRIPANASERNQWILKQVLDYGAFGIVAPRVQNAADVESLVRFCRYPQGVGAAEPEGERGMWKGPAQRYWGCSDFDEYHRRADLWPLNPEGEILLMAIIEDRHGVDNIEEIVRVPGLGAVMWGPGDGAMSLLGKFTSYDHPALIEASDKVLRACREVGVIVGSVASSDDKARREFERGFQFMLVNYAGGRRPDIEAAAST